MSATSYPRTETDWQGVFIRHVASALAARRDIDLALWAPDGPRHSDASYACTDADVRFLKQLADSGGIAHLLKQHKFRAVSAGTRLLARLGLAYRRAAAGTDIFHINWLQNALPLLGLRHPAVITVLGSDLKLLRLPGMVTAIRQVLRGRQTVLAPNAEWMCAPLEAHFGDLTPIEAVPLGIDNRWYEIEPEVTLPMKWIAVFRVTSDKIGPLFDWGRTLFDGTGRELHLIGPNQDGLSIPDWVHFHGPASPEELCAQWFPQAAGMVTLSQHSEGRPQVMLEAMAAGLPIVASDQPAHADFIEDGHSGRLVGSAAAFSRAVEEVEQASHRDAIAKHSRQFALDNYGTWDDCAARYRALYDRVGA